MALSSVPVTVHRYVRAQGIDDAHRHAQMGSQVSVDAGIDSRVHAQYVSTRVVQYHHTGAGGDLWRVSLNLRAVVDAVDARDARETAYGLVALDGRADAFEPELCVGDVMRELSRAS